MTNFAEIERDFIRKRVYPDFEWVVNSAPSKINPLKKSIRECNIALVTTAGVHRKSDKPFDITNPLGDHTYRVIPSEASLDSLMLSHVGYNTKKISQDINCVFPLERMRELENEGILGALNGRHFSFMGYTPITQPLLHETAPEVATQLREDAVDLVLLSPA